MENTMTVEQEKTAVVAQAIVPLPEPPAWKLLRFNPIRAARGAWAAEVECVMDGATNVVWMDRKAIEMNIADFGDHPELQKALRHYQTRIKYP